MKSMIKFGILAIVASLAAGCSFDTVPPATKGKILTTAGYSPDILPPGKYTLWGRDKLIILQTNTNVYKERVDIVLEDKLTLNADIRFRGRIAGDKGIINSMFNDISAGQDNTIGFDEVYAVYGRMLVRNKTREIISKYNVEDVHKNYSRLSAEISTALKEAFKSTPLEISDIALGQIEYPKVVNDAINAAKERELAIKKEQAQAEIELTKKKNEKLLAEAQYQIDITHAKAIRDKNKIIGQGVTKELLRLRALEVQEKMAENGSAVFMPFEAMGTVGAQTRMYSK